MSNRHRQAEPPSARMNFVPALGFVLALAVGSGATGSDALGGSFRDTFATLDHERWYISDGWSNGPHQNCLWSETAVAHAPGRLGLYFLTGRDADAHHRCGEIQTRSRFGHGTFEARVRTDTGSGLNAAFFTYIGPVHGERHDEIDFEVLTGKLHEVTVNTYVDGEPRHGATPDLPAPADAAFHVFSFIWEPDRLRWFVDGVQVHEATAQPLPERPQKIYLSLWGSDTLTDWMGPFDPPDRPIRMDIDWVAYTALGEPCQFAGSVLCVHAAE